MVDTSVINKRSYRSFTERRRVGCGGYIYVTIVFKGENFHFITIRSDSHNSCGQTWQYALAETLTFAIRRAKDKREVNAIIKGLLGHRCNNFPANEEHIVSCVDAVAKILKGVNLNGES